MTAWDPWIDMTDEEYDRLVADDAEAQDRADQMADADFKWDAASQDWFR